MVTPPAPCTPRGETTDVCVISILAAAHITFELYERTTGAADAKKEFSIGISISEGAHSPAVLDSSVDARHSLNVQARRKLTSSV